MIEQKYGHLNIPNGSLRVSITNKCNMDCFYCHNEGQGKEVEPDMSYDNFVRIMELAKSYGLRGLTFTGGEPLINKYFHKMFRWAVDNKLEKIDICTNGVLLPRFIDTISQSGRVKLAIGIDTCDPDKISKQSTRGVKFREIEKTLNLLKESGIGFDVNAVYTGENLLDIEAITEYCLEHRYNLRIIEMDTYRHITNEPISPEFRLFVGRHVDKYGLTLGFEHPGKGYYGINHDGSKVSFYHSKCHVRDCLNCARCHFRIDTLGRAIPCYARDLKLDLLVGDSIKAGENFLIAIYNLGIPPEKADQK